MTEQFLPSRDRWLHASCLQKAIRRNHPDLAEVSARFLWRWSPRYFTRRLAVIAFEDIGLANVGLLEAYLTEGVADEQRAVEWVQAFCASPKSRYLTRIGATVHYHTLYKELTASHAGAILTDHTEVAAQEPDILRAQAMALACTPEGLAAVMEREGHGRLARLMHLGNRQGCEGLPRILFATRNEQPLEIVPTYLSVPTQKQEFPLWVYDKHTRLGGRALKLFVPLVPELAGLTTETALWVAYRVLFRLESGLLDREVMFTADAAVEKVWWETLMVEGLTLPDVFRIRESLREKLPLLDDIRRQLLGKAR